MHIDLHAILLYDTPKKYNKDEVNHVPGQQSNTLSCMLLCTDRYLDDTRCSFFDPGSGGSMAALVIWACNAKNTSQADFQYGIVAVP